MRSRRAATCWQDCSRWILKQRCSAQGTDSAAFRAQSEAGSALVEAGLTRQHRADTAPEEQRSAPVPSQGTGTSGGWKDGEERTGGRRRQPLPRELPGCPWCSHSRLALVWGLLGALGPSPPPAAWER